MLLTCESREKIKRKRNYTDTSREEFKGCLGVPFGPRRRERSRQGASPPWRASVADAGGLAAAGGVPRAAQLFLASVCIDCAIVRSVCQKVAPVFFARGRKIFRCRRKSGAFDRRSAQWLEQIAGRDEGTGAPAELRNNRREGRRTGGRTGGSDRPARLNALSVK
jgi:hypothetical protein